MKLQPRVAGALGLLALGWVVSACRAADPFGQEPGVPRPATGAVVSAHPLATRAGLKILEDGGNAADAAVATALVLAVVYPQAGNLGGGGFAVWVPREGEPNTLDFRELAPAGFIPELYQDAAGEVVPERSLATPLAVGVPGTPAGLYELYRRYGSKAQGLTFADLCEPAISLAREGFQVDAWLARDLRSSGARARLEADPGARELFYPGGAPLAEGQVLKQPRLAATLERLARGGSKAFYGGPIAEAIVQSLRAADERAGIVAGSHSMTLEDLASYKVEQRKPLVGRFRGYEVISMGPPSSGGLVLLQVLAVLNGFPLDAERAAALSAFELGDDPSNTVCGVSPRRVHWWIEALRMAFADRAMHLGDPDKHAVPVRSLLSAGWVARRRVSIGEHARPNVAPWAPDPPPESDQTTHLSVLDGEGNAVSLTTTLNTSFGSGILVAEAGFLLNNELDDFSIQAGTPNLYGLVGGEANQLAPRKRPLSSMTPTVVRRSNGAVSLVIGSPGGPKIITAVLQVVLRVLVLEQDLESAIRAPRMHQQWKPQETLFEEGWPLALIEALGNRHGQPTRTIPNGRFGSVQGILVQPDGSVNAFSDARRGGVGGVQGEALPQPTRPAAQR